MPMNFLIRLFTEGDSLTELTTLLHASYAQLGAQGFNYTAVDQTEDITRERLEDGECYIALSEGRMLGTILFRDAEHAHGCPWYDRSDVSSFHQFGVLPDSQGQGIGGKLLTLVEAKAKETGAKEIACDTSEGAADLIHWYTRRGYRQVGHAQWEGKKYRSVLISKALGSPD